MKRFLLYAVSFLFFSICFLDGILGQQSNTLYFMDRIPQSNQSNPAMQPRCNLYLGLMGFSSFEMAAGNSALSFRDVYTYNESLDSLLNPLHRLNNVDDFLHNFRSTNSLFLDMRNDWLSFGFRIKDNYFTLAVTERMDGSMVYPGGLVRFLAKGNDYNKPVDLSGMGANISWYREYSLGYSRNLGDVLSFGVRAKLLTGVANLTSTKTDFEFYETGMDVWKARTNFDVNMSVPYLSVALDEDGLVDLENSDMDEVPDDPKQIVDIFLSRENLGFAADFGVQYTPIERLNVSASVLDLGYIKWKRNPFNMKMNSEFDFPGVEFFIDDSIDMGAGMVDTLLSNFKFNPSYDPYVSRLFPKVYIGASYDITKWFQVGVLSRFTSYQGTMNQQYTFSTQFNPIRAVTAGLSYTIADRNYSNLGFVLGLKAGPFQMYLASERIPLFYDKERSLGVPLPTYAKSAQYRMGFNMVFGCRKTKKAEKDIPLFY